jgi:hypothetical protein
MSKDPLLSIDALNIALSICTGLVVLGVFLEIAEYVEQELSAIGKHIYWLKTIPRLGFLLLLVGLAGEWKFQSAIGQFETDRIVALSPREISQEARQAIGKSCEKFSGRTVRITTEYNDPEGYRLGTEIEEALKISGIQVDDKRGQAGIDLTRPPQFGLIVIGPQVASALTYCVSNALETVGKFRLEPTGYPAYTLPPDNPVTVFVGLKPVD